MELRVNEVIIPEQIIFNYEELKTELQEKVSKYETLVYTDDQIKEAKQDKANLNKLKKALNDERIRLQKEYLIPFNDFKAKIDELINIIDTPVSLIDKQVKEYDEVQKTKKKEEIEEYFNGINFPTWVTFEMVFDEKWLNSSTSMKSTKGSLDDILERIKSDIDTLQNLPEFAFESLEVYKSTLDINKAISEGRRLSEIAKRKAEHEAEMKAREEEQARLKAEAEMKKQDEEFAQAINPPIAEVAATQETVVEPATPVKQWISFQACMTVEQARELKQFFDSRNIEFKAI